MKSCNFSLPTLGVLEFFQRSGHGLGLCEDAQSKMPAMPAMPMDDFSMIKPLGAHIGRGIHMIFFGFGMAIICSNSKNSKI
jgi:hypothetical protein